MALVLRVRPRSLFNNFVIKSWSLFPIAETDVDEADGKVRVDLEVYLYAYLR